MDSKYPLIAAMKEAAQAEGFAFAIYTVYAHKLRKAGYIEAAMRVEEFANNEMEHLEQWMEATGMMPSEDMILPEVEKFEEHDGSVMYPMLSKMLAENGDDKYAELATKLIDIELRHRNTAKALNLLYKEGVKPKTAEKWVCPHCGNMYDRYEDIPEECPVCHHKREEYVLREVVIEG